MSFFQILGKKLGGLKWRLAEKIRYLTYRYPLPGRRRFVKNFWNTQARRIHDRWGNHRHDFATLGNIIRRFRPQSILDVGCGSGRLFPLYQIHEVPEVLGIDISGEALELARQRFPEIPAIEGHLNEIHFPENRFDLAICNRVLQHIPGDALAEAVETLCQISRRVYVNELTNQEQLDENFYMMRHDYEAHFARCGYAVVETGRIDGQVYRLFAPASGSAKPAR